MLDAKLFVLFLGAATILAITPGPGIFYVLTRTLAGGRREGVMSALGTLVGGLVHVMAAGAGLSTILAASATAYATIKYAGAAYLIWIGIGMIRSRDVKLPTEANPRGDAFRQGIWTEVLNPKTALFFLSFIPQFVNVSLGHVVLQFLLLGGVSVILNTSADLVVIVFAGKLAKKMESSTRFRSNQRVASGAAMIGLGAYVALSESR
jgi:threonine/homoserine/homoserine lactone efflux protein